MAKTNKIECKDVGYIQLFFLHSFGHNLHPFCANEEKKSCNCGKQEMLISNSRILWVMFLHQQVCGMQTINESKKINGLPFSTFHITQRKKELVSTF
jgi:hypothetical protein